MSHPEFSAVSATLVGGGPKHHVIRRMESTVASHSGLLNADGVHACVRKLAVEVGGMCADPLPNGLIYPDQYIIRSSLASALPRPKRVDGLAPPMDVHRPGGCLRAGSSWFAP